MKRIFLVALAALSLAACQQKSDGTSTGSDSTVMSASASGDESSNQQGPVLKFDTDTYDFGAIKKGETVSYSFKFKNTGDVPLIIKDAIATCGCTVPEPPVDPILPGKESEIKVVFNSAGKPIGTIRKAVNVTSNAVNNPVQLNMVGEIKE